MPHLMPVVIPGGGSVQGQSLGFRAVSLRIDNLSNQWLQEQTTLAWIPPYSLGTCLRLYGCAVAIVLNTHPTGQPQLAPIAGEYAAGFFSDEYRTEVAGVPVRQFTLVQSVSDLTEGPQPALPPVSVDRLYADSAGNIHHLHSDGTDLILADAVLVLGGALAGHLPNPTLAPGSVGAPQLVAGAAAANVGTLTGALAGSVLPNTAIALNTDSLLSGDVSITPSIFHTLLFTALLGPIGAVWRIYWKALITASVDKAYVTGSLFSAAGGVLDMSGQTCMLNYGGALGEVTLSGMATTTALAANDQCSIRIYTPNSGCIARARDANYASGTATWLRCERVG